MADDRPDIEIYLHCTPWKEVSVIDILGKKTADTPQFLANRTEVSSDTESYVNFT